MKKYLNYIIAVMVMVALILVGCGNSSSDDFWDPSSVAEIVEKKAQVEPNGSISMYTQSGISVKAQEGTFDSDVSVKVREEKPSESLSSEFSTASNLITISAEKASGSSFSEIKKRVTSVEKPVTIVVPNNLMKQGVYYIGSRANSSRSWKYTVINDGNSPTNPLMLSSRYATDNCPLEFYVTTYDVAFQFAVFLEAKDTPVSPKTVITNFTAEAEPSEYVLEKGFYKDDIKVKVAISGDNLGNLNSGNYIVELGFLNDDKYEYNLSTFPISGASADYKVSTEDAGAGNKYKHTVILKNISDYNNNTLSFTIGASKLTTQILPDNFTVTVNVDEGTDILPYKDTKGIILTNKSKDNPQEHEITYIKVVSTSPANSATGVATDSNSVITIEFEKELKADTEWGSFVTLTSGTDIIPVSYEYNDKTLTLKHSGILPDKIYTVKINEGIKGTEEYTESAAYAFAFSTIKHAETTVTAEMKTPAATSDVGVSTKIEIAFSEDIKWEPESQKLVTLLLGTTQVECAYFYENKVLTLTPVEKLGFNKTYAVCVSKYLALQNESAEMQGDQRFEFSTVASEGTPSITSDTSKSVDGKYYLVADQKFSIDFNKVIINEETAKQKIYMQKDGIAFHDFSVEFDADMQVANINVNVAFEVDKTYKVAVAGFTDNDGSVVKSAECSFTAMSAIELENLELDCGSGWQQASGSSDVAVTGKMRVTLTQVAEPNMVLVKLVDEKGVETTGPVFSTTTTEKNTVIEFNYSSLKYLTKYGAVISYTDTVTGQSLKSDIIQFETTVPDCLALADPSQPNSETNPYLVYTAAALDQIREEEYLAQGYYFKQMANIDLAPNVYSSDNNKLPEGWRPFGYCSSSPTVGFIGHYNGNNMSISNLYCNAELDSESLFGVILEGSVSNLAIENVQISGTYCIGALAGIVDNGVIDNCHSSGNINGSESEIGGLIGSGENLNISNCYSTANINIGGTCSGSGIGGLIGYCYQTFASNCYALGDVNGGDYSVGGLIGEIESGAVVNSYTNNNKITGGEMWVGGLVGELGIDVVVYNCHCDNIVVEATGDGVGGLIGEGFGNIAECFTSGTVTGYDMVGGIIGASGGNAFGLYSVVRNSDSNCYVTGHDMVGGIIGLNSCGIYDDIGHNNNVTGETERVDPMVGYDEYWDYE